MFDNPKLSMTWIRKSLLIMQADFQRIIHRHRNKITIPLFVLWLLSSIFYAQGVYAHIVDKLPVAQILPELLLMFWNRGFWGGDPLLRHCLVTLLPTVFASIILISECSLYHHPWSNGDIGRNEFRSVEIIQFVIHCVTYLSCACNVYLAHGSNTFFAENPVCMLNAVACCIPLTICILQQTFRLTFRRMANFAIAAANTILYLTVLDSACIGGRIFGHLGTESTRSNLAYALFRIPDSIKTGIVVAVAAAILKDTISDFLSDITSRHPSNLSQRRRNNRRRLLTHWYYKKDGTVSSWENSAVVLMLFEIALFTIATCLVFHKTDYINALASTTDTELPLPFSLYLLGCAILIFIPAIMSIWTISDEQLIQSEYTYLINKASLLHPEDIKNSSNHWLDFCQVLVNLYSNVSGLESEDRGFHNLGPFLYQLHKFLGQNDPCASARFFSDILSFKGDINAMLLRESNHEGADDEKTQHKKNTMIQRARDIQFAHNILELMKNYWRQKSDESKFQKACPLNTQDTLFMIMNISQAFFEKIGHIWGQGFGAYNLTENEAKQILQMDTLVHILRRDSTTYCSLSRYGCPSADNCNTCPTPHNSVVDANTITSKRIELELLYPFVVIDCFKQRWNDNIADDAFQNNTVEYYKELIDKNIILGIEDNQIEKILITAASGAVEHLYASGTNTKILSYTALILDPSSNPQTHTSFQSNRRSPEDENRIRTKISNSTSAFLNAISADRYTIGREPLGAAAGRAVSAPSSTATTAEFGDPNTPTSVTQVLHAIAARNANLYHPLLRIAYAIHYPTKEENPDDE